MGAFPDFTSSGDLPVGLHCGALTEVVAHFGNGSSQRRIVGQRLDRIYRLARGTASLQRFIIFGSFITDKAAPNDVNLFLVMADGFDLATVRGEMRYLFDHMAADNLLGASIFWIPRAACIGGEDAAVLDWQIKRDGTSRGLVEIVSL